VSFASQAKLQTPKWKYGVFMKFSECQTRLHKRKARIEGFPAAVLFICLNCVKQTQIVPNPLLNPE